jgi:cytochrome oxidase Cu insertion factor (SCO1/SenC/PrrC family)/mono/diheme cytochrome c family protein
MAKNALWKGVFGFCVVAALSAGALAAKRDIVRVARVLTQSKAAVRVNPNAPGRNWFPNGTLTSDIGEPVRIFDDLLEGKVVLVNFIFTSCRGSCPSETARLKKVYNLLQDRMGEDVFFLSISVDPERDTPEKLAEYKARYKIGKGWNFYRGDKALVDEFQKSLGLLLDESDKQDELDHSLNIIIGNQATGKWIKRSHLENAKILETLIRQLHETQEQKLALKDYAQAPTHVQDAERGEKLFYSRCADCHTIGQGNSLGPDLAHVGQRRTAEWLDRWLENPGKMIEAKDPIALGLYEAYNKVEMPNLKLSPDDRKAVLDFIEKESANALAH